MIRAATIITDMFFTGADTPYVFSTFFAGKEWFSF